MRFWPQPPPPWLRRSEGVQQGGDSQTGTEPFGSKLQESGGGGVKQQGVERPGVLKGERTQDRRQGEDPVVIADGQQCRLLPVQPDFAGTDGALGAMAVAAALRTPMGHGAHVTLPERPAQVSGVTPAETSQNLTGMRSEWSGECRQEAA